jgi:predicted metal-binding membrane protein
VVLDINTMTVAAALLLFGVQLALFGMLAKKYMVATGLLPETTRFARINQRLTLEAGLITGLLLFVVGVVIIVRVFTSWQAVGFADLDPSSSARQTIVGAVALILAGQVGFTSLFMSILGLNFRAR